MSRLISHTWGWLGASYSQLGVSKKSCLFTCDIDLPRILPRILDFSENYSWRCIPWFLYVFFCGKKKDM